MLSCIFCKSREIIIILHFLLRCIPSSSHTFQWSSFTGLPPSQAHFLNQTTNIRPGAVFDGGSFFKNYLLLLCKFSDSSDFDSDTLLLI